MTAIDGYIGLLQLCNSKSYDQFLADMQCRWIEALYELLSDDNYIRKCKNSDTEERYNHNHDPHTGRFTSGSGINTVDNSVESGIIMIGKSLSAKAKNYPVKLPDSRQHTKLAEGQTIIGKVFAGKTTDKEIRDRFRLESTYNIPANEWMKVSGKGKIVIGGKEMFAELHWYEANGERHEIKVKRFIDESKVHKSK